MKACVFLSAVNDYLHSVLGATAVEDQVIDFLNPEGKKPTHPSGRK